MHFSEQTVTERILSVCLPNTTLVWWVAVLLQNRFELGILGRTMSAGEAVVISQFPSTGCLRQSAIFSQHVTGTKPHQMLLINDSFSSQTWAIFLPNRNFSVKSIWCPTRPPVVRSQNQGYAKYSSILPKHHFSNSYCLASRWFKEFY